MLGKGPTISLSPFLNNTTSLIESFLIIGYSSQTIKPLRIKTSHILSSVPSILSFISNGKPSHHYDHICKYVFPSQPIVYNRQYAPYHKSKKTKFTFFFQNFNSNVTQQQCNNQSGCFAGFVYMFNETFFDSEKNGVSVPKAFCLVVRNCCFGFCNKLCELLYAQYKQGVDSIPIEIVVYNVVNFIPAPVNWNIMVDMENLLVCRSESPRRSTISTSYSDNISRRTLLDTKYKYFIEQFVGYPQFQFCVYDILKFISYKHLVEIILYMLFEFNVIFFSGNVDVLYNVMYICVMLTYPLMDSHLMGQIMCISDRDFNNKQFDINVKNYILGVNASFGKCKHSAYFANAEKFIIVDIDDNQIVTCAHMRHKVKSLKVDDDTKQMIEIITRLINKKKISCPHFENTFQKLLMALSEFNKRNLKLSMDLQNNDLFSYDLSDENKNLNIEFQGMFYLGIVSFLKYFYQFYSTSINENFGDFSDATNDPVIVTEIDNIKISKEEKLIISFFSKTMNAERYFKCFLKKRQIIDNYHIPFLFTDELIQSKYFMEHILLNAKLDILGKDCLYLIDKIYLSSNGNQIREIDFSEFHSFYQKEQLKETFITHLYESPFYIKTYSKKGEVTFHGKHIEFDNDILFKYSYILCNIDSLEKVFPSLNVFYLNEIPLISTVLIETEIESHFILFQESKSKDIILCTYYYLIACIAESIDLPCQFNALVSTLPLYGFSMRKAFNVILTIYSNILQRKYKDKQIMHEDIEYLDKMLQYVLANGVLPNEMFIRLMKQLLLLKKMVKFFYENKVGKKEKQVLDNKDVHFDLVCDDLSIKKREIKNHIVKLLESGIADCDLSLQGKGNKAFDVKSIWMNMSISKINFKINTSVYSPIKLYKKVQSLTMEYISTGNRDIFKTDKFKQIISMQMFYMHYIEDLKKISFEPLIKYLKLYDK